jgi:DNA-binding response OmpR family regulator
MAPDPNTSTQEDDPGSGATRLKGARIFLVEDEFLVALALEDDLRAAGCIVVGPFGDLAAATDAARTETFDLALLDVNLCGERAYALADELFARRLPFVLLSGYGKTDLPERFRDSPRVAKPYHLATLLREIARNLPSAR